MHPEGETLQIKQDVGDVFLHAFYGGVLVEHILDFNLNHCGPGH